MLDKPMQYPSKNTDCLAVCGKLLRVLNKKGVLVTITFLWYIPQLKSGENAMIEGLKA